MKNFKNSTLALMLSLCALVLFQTGCKSSLAPTDTSSRRPLLSEIAPSSILSRYDTSNLVGLLEPRKESYSIVSHSFPASGRSNWDGTQSWGQGNFIDPSTGDPLDVGVVIFNQQFGNTVVSSGTSGNYSYDAKDLTFYTDGSTYNKVLILPFDSTGAHGKDSLTFSGMPHITNITRGQNISRDSGGITVNWTGTSGDFVLLSVMVWDSTGTHDTVGHGISISNYYDNTGSATLTFDKSQLYKGLADIELVKYEPKFITLSNGKRVAIVSETAQEITVNIVD